MPSVPSPLFTPALWEEGRFKILDETLLPERIEYIPITDTSEALRAVKEMKTRAFGQVLTFLYAVALAARGCGGNDPGPLKSRISRLAEEFTAARPTFDFTGIARWFDPWFRELPPGRDAGQWIEDKIHEFVSFIEKTRMERARRAAELLPDPCTLLTHCNVSGELVAVAEWRREMGREIRILATETRPYLQGTRLTAWELSRAAFPVALLPDCAVAQALAKGEAQAVLVGADRCAQNGDIINKVGTYPLAVTAREYNVPFHVLVQEPGPLASGEDVVIEERPVAELFHFHGRSYAPEGLQGRYPAFDVTPARLVSSLIGFNGVWTPEEFRKKFQTASAGPGRTTGEREPYLLLYGIPRASGYPYLSHALMAERASSLLVPEMRPELWGVHRVSRELLQRKMPATLISDNMMGSFFAKRQVKRLCLFYSRLTEKGPVGICGSLLAVLLARAHGVPVELVESEERLECAADRDVSTFLGQRVAPDGVEIYQVEKETVPWSLFRENKEGGS